MVLIATQHMFTRNVLSPALSCAAFANAQWCKQGTLASLMRKLAGHFGLNEPFGCVARNAVALVLLRIFLRVSQVADDNARANLVYRDWCAHAAACHE